MFIVLAVSVVVLFLTKKKTAAPATPTTPVIQNPPQPATPAAAATPTTPATTVTPKVDDGYPIYYMKKHEDVKALQTALGFTGKDVDGIIGNKTLDKSNAYGFGLTIAFQIQSKAVLNGMIAKIQTQQKLTAIPAPLWLGAVNK